LNLGTSLHYVGIQFYPGVWQGRNEEILDRYVGTPYSGALPLIDVSRTIAPLGFAEEGLSFFLCKWPGGQGGIRSGKTSAK